MKRIFWVVLAAALATAGCSDPVPPTSPTPVTPTIKETFSDTLLVAGSNTHTFSVDAVGGLKVTLISVEPGAIVGIGVGTPSLGSCSVLDHVAAVAGNDVLLSGTATTTGLFCVMIYDLGNLVEPAMYTIDVLHS